jgi:hypothetical protein
VQFWLNNRCSNSTTAGSNELVAEVGSSPAGHWYAAGTIWPILVNDGRKPYAVVADGLPVGQPERWGDHDARNLLGVGNPGNAEQKHEHRAGGHESRTESKGHGVPCSSTRALLPTTRGATRARLAPPAARGSGRTRKVLARDKGDLGGAMRLRTKALAVAAGAVPLLFGGTTPAEASEAVSATQTFTFERSRSSVMCTFTGTSQVEYFAESDAPTAILARTLLVDDHNDPNCRSLGYAFVEVAFKRDGASTFEYAYSVSDDFDANVGLRLEGAIVDVVVRHGASYDCDASRPCTGTFITNPK